MKVVNHLEDIKVEVQVKKRKLKKLKINKHGKVEEDHHHLLVNLEDWKKLKKIDILHKVHLENQIKKV